MVFGELCLVLQHWAGGGGCWAKGCSHILIQRVLKLQAKQNPELCKVFTFDQRKEGKIKGILQWKSTQVSLHSGVEGLCVCLCFGYSPELPSTPKTKVNKLVNYGWHIPLFLIFFFILAVFSKQEPTPSPLYRPGTLHNTISSPQFPGFPGSTHRAETGRWLQDASKILIQRASFCCVLAVGRAHVWPWEHLSHHPHCALQLW